MKAHEDPALLEMRAMHDSLPPADSIPPSAFVLAQAIRELIETALMTDVDPAERAAVAAEVRALQQRLAVAQRGDPVWTIRHPDGAIEHLTQFGTGRLNPAALMVEWLTPDGQIAYDALAHPETGEVLARCTLTRSYIGPPNRAHGGVVATILDQVVGFATAAVGKPGMTAGLDVRYKAATPLGVPLLVNARYTHSEGRKHFATGEITVDGAVTASAFGVFIGHPQWNKSQ